MIDQKSKDAIDRLRRDSDFIQFIDYLIQEREAKREDLEHSTATVQTHKLQGYCLALSDLINLCSSERR